MKHAFRTILAGAGLTPRFLDPAGSGEVDIHYGFRPDRPSRLFIQRSEGDWLPERVIEAEGLYFILAKGEEPIRPILGLAEGRAFLANDIIRAASYFLTGRQDEGLARDGRDCHLIEGVFAYRQRLLHHPFLDYYSGFIRDLLLPSHEPSPLWPNGKSYAVALTHDVDYPEMIRWIEVGRYLLRSLSRARAGVLLDIMAGRNHFWRFEGWRDMEESFNARSAFYLCGRRGSLPGYCLKAPDPLYDVTAPRFKETLGRLAEAEFEIGVHFSYLAYRSVDQMRLEVARVEEASGSPVLGGRHHCWHLNQDDPTETFDRHHKIGLLYDASLAYERRAGFRYGTCHPFFPYNRRRREAGPLVQLPTALMDDHLFGYSGHGYLGGPEEEIDALLASVRRAGGALVVDYHQRVLNETFFPGWARSYLHLLGQVASDERAYIDTPASLAKIWLARRERLSRLETDETGRFD